MWKQEEELLLRAQVLCKLVELLALEKEFVGVSPIISTAAFSSDCIH
jgi:hypothetical protein